jgi:chromosome segregation ATPase
MKKNFDTPTSGKRKSSPLQQQQQKKTLNNYYASIVHKSPQNSPQEMALSPEMAAFSDKMDKILDSARRGEEKLNQIDQKFDNLQVKVNELESGLNFLSVKQDEQLQQQVSLKADNEVLRRKLSSLELKLNGVENAIQGEAVKRDENENVQRKQCLEISGIPKPEESESETRKACKDKVAAVLRFMGAEDATKSIDDAHRKMNGQMIVRFKDRESRNIVYDKRFTLTDKSSNDVPELPTRPEGEGFDMYVNESLTLDRSRLAKRVRDSLKQINRRLPKERKIKFKTAGGNLFCENNLKSRYVRIRTWTDFEMIHPTAIDNEQHIS